MDMDFHAWEAGNANRQHDQQGRSSLAVNAMLAVVWLVVLASVGAIVDQLVRLALAI